MQDWQTWIKGIYDVEGMPPGYLVTGSARMDMLRKTGDSLAGRFFSYRLHPLDVKEATSVFEPAEALRRILTVGGFPEPFLEGDPVAYASWKKSHIDVILRYDMLDLTGMVDIVAMETLLEWMVRCSYRPVGNQTGISNDLVEFHGAISRRKPKSQAPNPASCTVSGSTTAPGAGDAAGRR